MSLRRTTSVSQKLPEDFEARVHEFMCRIIHTRRHYQFPLSGIVNMDETAIWADMPGGQTYNVAGERTVLARTTGHEKQRITITLGACADGSKLPIQVLTLFTMART